MVGHLTRWFKPQTSQRILYKHKKSKRPPLFLATIVLTYEILRRRIHVVSDLILEREVGYLERGSIKERLQARGNYGPMSSQVGQPTEGILYFGNS